MNRTRDRFRDLSYGILLIAALFLVWLTNQRFPFSTSFLFHVLKQAVLLGAFSSALMGWGLAILALFRSPGPHRGGFLWVLGATFLATLLGLLGPLYFPGPWISGLITGVGVFFAVLLFRRIERPVFHFQIPAEFLILFVLLIPPALLALAPSLSLDALVYHLAVPGQAILKGQLIPSPTNIHTFFPMHAEVLYGLLLPLGGPVACQGLHFLAGMIALSSLVRFQRIRGGSLSLMPVIVLAGVPVLNVILGWAWNDWFVLLFLGEGLIERERFRAGADEGSAVRSALCFAAAASVKYYALPLLLLAPKPRRRRSLVLAGLLTIVTLAPWYGRNLVVKGNPIYPILSAHTGASALTQYRQGEGGPIPVMDYLGRKDLVDESVGVLLPLMILLVPLAGFRRFREDPLPFLLILMYLGAGFVVHPTARFFAPAMMLICILGGEVLSVWHARRSRAVMVIVAMLSCINLVQIVKVVTYFDPVEPALGLVKAETYLDESQSYLHAFRWIQERTDPRERIMVVGESRIYYLNRPAIAASYLDPPPYTPWISRDRSPDGLADRLMKDRICWIFVNRAQYRPGQAAVQPVRELRFDASEEEDSLFETMLASRGVRVYAKGFIEIWHLESSAGRDIRE